MFADRHGIPRILPDADGRDAQYARFCKALRRELEDAKETLATRTKKRICTPARRPGAERKQGRNI